MVKKISTLSREWFVVLLGIVGLVVVGFVVNVPEAGASCARHRLHDVWINPNPDGYITSAELHGSCYEPGEYAKARFRIGERQFDWDRLEVLGDSYATDTRVFSNARVTMRYRYLSSGWLKVTISVDYTNPQKRDFSRTDYLLRVLSGKLSQYSVASCGIGCIAGSDVAYVSFAAWAGGSVQARQDATNMFCVMGGNSRCNPLPYNWRLINAEIWLKDGTRTTYSWEVDGHHSPIRSVWPYPNNEGLASEPIASPEPGNDQTDADQDTGNQDSQSEPIVVSTPQPIPTPPANDPACRRPNIVSFYAVELPDSTEAEPQFRLFYEVEGADIVEFYGNRVNPQEGHLDVEKPGYWSVWAKVEGTADSCFAERTIHVISAQ
jgi:hypothetical protein